MVSPDCGAGGDRLTFQHPARSDRASKKLPFAGEAKYWDMKIFPKALFPWSPESGGRPLQAFTGNHVFRLCFIGGMHVAALAAPFHFNWGAFKWFVGLSVASSFGMTASFHRQVAHRSFECVRWLEYLIAFLGCLAMEGAPIGWARIHRYHHEHSDGELDVHSPMDGFWWSHIGFMFDPSTTDKVAPYSKVKDLEQHLLYRLLDNSAIYTLVTAWIPVFALNALGGWSYVLWGFVMRVVYVWNVTWCINSVGHIWGYQSFRSGDHSMNNPVLGVLGFGDGWHNNHHAFPASCRHGFAWYEIDVVWYILRLWEKVGLAWNLKYPSEKRMQDLAIV